MLQVRGEIRPALVGLQLRVLREAIELLARVIERWHARFAAAGDVDRCEIERQADEVVAERLGDELVDLVADLACHAAHDRAGRFVRIHAILIERERIQERRDETHLLSGRVEAVRVADDVEIGVVAIHRLVEHRVPEAIDDIGELRHDRRIDRGVVSDGRKERVDVRLDLAGELFEHEVLVLHLGGEARCLEQSFAVPVE